MEGVTILASEVVMTSSTVMNIISIISIALFGLGLISFVIGYITACQEIAGTGVVMLICFFALFLISLPIDSATQVPDYTKYEVILDDSVSMNDFMSTYEVLEQRGQIYVVKEIEVE